MSAFMICSWDFYYVGGIVIKRIFMSLKYDNAFLSDWNETLLWWLCSFLKIWYTISLPTSEFCFSCSKIKMVNELLEGIHLVASMEAILLGTQAGIHPWILYDIISNAAGSSWWLPQLLELLLPGWKVILIS